MDTINQLSFKTNTENGLSVELFIDGKSIDDIFNAGDPMIPSWHFEDDLPYYPPYRKYATDFSRHLIGVCDCGEYGCGNINCHVEKHQGLVVWSDFKGDLPGNQSSPNFVFDEQQYVKTISEILEIVDAYKSSQNVK